MNASMASDSDKPMLAGTDALSAVRIEARRWTDGTKTVRETCAYGSKKEREDETPVTSLPVASRVVTVWWSASITSCCTADGRQSSRNNPVAAANNRSLADACRCSRRAAYICSQYRLASFRVPCMERVCVDTKSAIKSGACPAARFAWSWQTFA